VFGILWLTLSSFRDAGLVRWCDVRRTVCAEVQHLPCGRSHDDPLPDQHGHQHPLWLQEAYLKVVLGGVRYMRHRGA